MARDPQNRRNSGRHAASLAALGSLQERRGRNREAEPLLRRALDLFERLDADGHLEPEFRDRFPICEGDLGLVYKNTGRLAEAEKSYRGAAERLDTWLKAEPADSRYRGALAVVLSNLAIVQYAAGRQDEARESEMRSIALLEALADEFPEMHVYRGLLLATQSNRLLSLVLEGRIEEAERVVRQVVEQGDALIRDHPAVPGYREELGKVLSRAADLYCVSPREPFHNPERALELARRAVELRSDNRDMAWQSLGWARYRAGDWKGCIETLNRMKEVLGSGFVLAMAHRQLGEEAKAREVFQRADKWLADYEKRWTPDVYPTPAMLKCFRDEAAALLHAAPPGEDGQPRHPTGAPGPSP